jgi:hypothetical protein
VDPEEKEADEEDDFPILPFTGAFNPALSVAKRGLLLCGNSDRMGAGSNLRVLHMLEASARTNTVSGKAS